MMYGLIRNTAKRILAPMAAVVICAGCSGIMPPKDPYTLNVHMGAEPGTLNPITATDAYSHAINLRIYETLVDRDYDTLEVKPQLAERWDMTPDKLRFRFFFEKGRALERWCRVHRG